MAAPSIDELILLDVDTRLEIISKLWDSLEDHNAELTLSEEDRALIEKRRFDHESAPSDVEPWDVVKARLTKR